LKLGLFGGTFDPVHMGHLVVAEETRVRLGLDQVLFVPAGRPWFKADQAVSDARHRLAMVEMAIGGNPHFGLSDTEIRRPGASYTVDTLVELRDTHPGEIQVYVIAGLDALQEVDRWHRPLDVLALATLVGYARPGAQILARGAIDSLRSGASEEVVVIEGPLIGISSSEIRERVARGLSISYLVPEAVERYIDEHGLYGDPRGRVGG
jgi:nicotinate-nucleotide adenylyltransferase